MSGELLTRITIWVTIAGYTAGAAAVLARKGREWERAARVVWTVACIALIAHAVCAFHFYHGWSQTAAYLDTARQTDEVFGLDWGGGLYINYALLVLWVTDVIFWWRNGLEAYRRRPWPLMAAWHGLLIFIFFNATVVFKTGFVRWAGLGICLGLCLVWWRAGVNDAPRGSGPFPLTIAEE